MKRLRFQEKKSSKFTYTIVNNDIINDQRLTTDEKMLLIYLYQRENAFKEWSDTHLREFLGNPDEKTGKVNPMGIVKFKKVKSKLRKLGYLEIKQYSTKNKGSFSSQCDYNVLKYRP